MAEVKILVVDDEPAIRKLLERGLTGYGYNVVTTSSGQEALTIAARQAPDIILLDIKLETHPNGLEVCQQLREWSKTPIIMLTVEDHKQTKLAALNAGADDYVIKPFDMEELEARIRAVLRRSVIAETDTLDGVIQAHELVIDLVKRRVILKGNEIHLTPIEYKLLCVLAKHPGKVLTFNTLIQEIKGAPGSSKPQQYVRVYVNTLRKKLQDDFAHTTHPLYIYNEPGVGYRFTDLQSVG